MSQLNDSRGWATRRGFLGLCAGVALGVVGGFRPGWARGRGSRSPLPMSEEGCHGFAETPLQTEHPEPRPGIDAYGSPSALRSFAPETVANTGGGTSHQNMQPWTAINFCIAIQGLFPSRS